MAQQTIAPPTAQQYWGVLQKQKGDVFGWASYNIVLGTFGLWATWAISTWLLKKPAPAQLVSSGGLAIFVATLCATQASLFSEVTGASFRSLNKNLLGFFFVLFGLSTIVAMLAGLQPIRDLLEPTAIEYSSYALFITGTVSCLFLYLTRLVYAAAEFADDEAKRQDLIAKAAHTNTKIDDTDI